MKWVIEVRVAELDISGHSAGVPDIKMNFLISIYLLNPVDSSGLGVDWGFSMERW